MIDKKERAQLRKLAILKDSIYTVGKLGISDNLIATLSDALDAKELIKISVLKTAPAGIKDIANQMAETLNADIVTLIGFKIILYRRSDKKNIKHRLDI